MIYSVIGATVGGGLSTVVLSLISSVNKILGKRNQIIACHQERKEPKKMAMNDKVPEIHNVKNKNLLNNNIKEEVKIKKQAKKFR